MVAHLRHGRRRRSRASARASHSRSAEPHRPASLSFRDGHHLSRPWRHPHRARAQRPARPRRARRAADHGLHPRGRRIRTATAGRISSSCRAGPGFEATRPTSPPTRLDGAGPQGLPGPAPRPARHRPLDPGRAGSSRATRPRRRPTYLTHFRADSIVRDAELIRRELGVDRWSVLGQSFGGFTSMTYLSFAPEGLREAFITGGLAPIGRPVDDIYGATYSRARSTGTSATSSATRTTGRGSARSFAGSMTEDVRLPSGDRLTGAPLPAARACGSATAPASSCSTTSSSCRWTRPRSATTSRRQSQFSRNPIYATLHESSYADGVATRWSADRLLPDEVRRGYFTAEHVYPVDVGRLRRAAPHKAAAEILAEHPWPRAVRRRTRSRATRSRSRRRSTSTTCTSSGRSPKRPPRRSAACGRGSPTSTSTTGCAPTASASSTASSTCCAAARSVRWGGRRASVACSSEPPRPRPRLAHRSRRQIP